MNHLFYFHWPYDHSVCLFISVLKAEINFVILLKGYTVNGLAGNSDGLTSVCLSLSGWKKNTTLKMKLWKQISLLAKELPPWLPLHASYSDHSLSDLWCPTFVHWPICSSWSWFTSELYQLSILTVFMAHVEDKLHVLEVERKDASINPTQLQSSACFCLLLGCAFDLQPIRQSANKEVFICSLL